MDRDPIDYLPISAEDGKEAILPPLSKLIAPVVTALKSSLLWNCFPIVVFLPEKRVLIGDSCSSSLAYEIPQDSILNPLVNIFVKPVDEVVRRFGLKQANCVLKPPLLLPQSKPVSGSSNAFG